MPDSGFPKFAFAAAVISGLAVAAFFISSAVEAQEAENPSAAQFLAPQKIVWEFGLTINATGPASGISATVPVPRDWPEQKLLSATPQQSQNVSRSKFDEPTDESKQLLFTVNRMNGGDTAEALIRFEIEKRMTVAPKETGNLSIASPPPRTLRKFIKPSPSIESTHKRIQQIAEQLHDESLSGWQQVELIYKWVRDNIEYKFDTELHSCLEALDSGHGDCEELSSLFIAICRAMDIPARAVWIPGHTYPEFYLEDKNGDGHWFPCQAAGDYQFGAMTELRPILQKGDKFRLPGKSGYFRYLQPTLKARDARGELSIEWISREIKAPPVSAPTQP